VGGPQQSLLLLLLMDGSLLVRGAETVDGAGLCQPLLLGAVEEAGIGEVNRMAHLRWPGAEAVGVGIVMTTLEGSPLLEGTRHHSGDLDVVGAEDVDVLGPQDHAALREEIRGTIDVAKPYYTTATLSLVNNIQFDLPCLICTTIHKSVSILDVREICNNYYLSSTLKLCLHQLHHHNTFHNRQLRVDDTARRCSNTDVVCQNNKLDVQHPTLSNSANRNACAGLIVPIQPRLRSIWFLMNENCVPRSRRATQRARIWGISHQRFSDLLWTGRRPFGESYRHTFGVAIDHWYTIARSGNTERMTGVHIKSMLPIIRFPYTAQDLERFPFHFFFLAADVWNNVVHDV